MKFETFYDEQISVDYVKIKDSPWRKACELYTFQKILGNQNNFDAVDFACGFGFYTKILQLQTNGSIVGIDISPHMI